METNAATPCAKYEDIQNAYPKIVVVARAKVGHTLEMERAGNNQNLRRDGSQSKQPSNKAKKGMPKTKARSN